MSTSIRHGSGRARLRAGPLHLKRPTLTADLQYAESVRNAQLDALTASLGSLPVLQLRTGPPPPNCASPDAGNLLAEVVLPDPWMPPAQGGEIRSAAPWTGTAIAAGTLGHFRVKDTTRSTCLVQGSIGRTGSGACLEFDFTDLEPDDVFSVDEFTVSAGNG